MPEGRRSGRRVATSIDGAEHGDILGCLMAVTRGTLSIAHDPKRSDRELPHL